MRVTFGNGAAWRAFYITKGTKANPGSVMFSIGIDPSWRGPMTPYGGSRILWGRNRRRTTTKAFG